jgi:hypothetical protein
VWTIKNVVTLGWTKLHSKDLHTVHSTPDTLLGLFGLWNQEDWISRSCSAHGAHEECVQNLSWKSLNKGTTSKTLA